MNKMISFAEILAAFASELADVRFRTDSRGHLRTADGCCPITALAQKRTGRRFYTCQTEEALCAMGYDMEISENRDTEEWVICAADNPRDPNRVPLQQALRFA